MAYLSNFISFKTHIYLRPGIAALGRDARGVAAVEFGLIGGLFLLLICFWIEVGLSLFMQAALDRAVRKESRLIRTGAITASGASTFSANLCTDLQALMTCSNIQVNVASATSFAALSSAVPTSTTSRMTTTGFAPGSSGQDVIVQVGYTRSLYFPSWIPSSGRTAPCWSTRRWPSRTSPTEMARGTRFGSDARASIAVEFALVAPVMATLLFGSVSAARLARASVKTWNVAQSLGDLVAQQVTLTTAEMTDFCTGGKLTLAPFTGTLTATVASVTYGTSGTRAVDWQDTTCGGATLSNASTLGAAYTPNLGDSVIVVQATYVYAFPPSYILPSSFTFTRTTYSRPRGGTAVAHA